VAAAEYYKERAEAAEKSRDAYKQQAADNWDLYEEEHKRAEVLKSATSDRANAFQSQGLGVQLLQQQVTDYSGELKGVRSDLKVCESQKFRNTILGFGAGIGTGLFMKH
jgi:hypothetical protein